MRAGPLLSALLLPAMPLAGCAVQAGMPEMKCPTIPGPRADVGPALPRPDSQEDLALSPGHWEWDLGKYDWVPRDWLKRPAHPHIRNAPILWKGGFWTPDGGACVWTAGRFVS